MSRSPQELNWKRLKQRFVSADRSKYRWLAECRDLYDSFDADAGVYFVDCVDDKAVDELVARFGQDDSPDRILGIFDLSKSLEEQGIGLTRDEWRSRR